jgi:hypothetical protein
MSWSINVIGPRAKIIEEVAKAQYLPAGIKSAIIETLQKSNQDGARVATNGYHYDNGVGTHGLRVSLLEVETFQVTEDRVCCDKATPYPTSEPERKHY